MDEKTIKTLEYPKVLEKLADYASFGVSAEIARALRPSTDFDEVKQRLARTSEARKLLSVNDDFTIGGARDIRAAVDLAGRGGVLEASELLDVKNTLVAARILARYFDQRGIDPQGADYPHLKKLTDRLAPPPGIVDGISHAISDRGDVLDSASQKLRSIRSELKTSYDRLMTRLERLINDPKNASILQEPIITQRNGRYVVPLRSEFKGRMRSIVHDQSSSGATLFVEPLATVELNNRWHELQLAERDEVRRILAELSSLVGEHSGEIKDMLEAMAELDFALMCAKYSEDLHANEPVLVPARKPTETHPGTTIRLFMARHPLLDPQKVVPIDVDLDEKTFAVVITGPNTGGKTVSLKTVGLMVLMAQSGLHIPAQSGSTLSLFKNIYADIGDEQSIEQSLSTFSGHVTNIIRIIKQAWPDTLVLLDELGAGTDPQEGAALARALLEYLIAKKIPCLVATHYPELKAFAHSASGAVNASMEFDLQSLRPTYHLTIGLPGRSNALLIAERLGLPKPILENARSTINPEDLRAEDLLDEIHRQRDLSRKARAETEAARDDAQKLRRDLALRLERIEDERMKVLDESRRNTERELGELQRELESIRRELIRARQPVEALKAVQEKLEILEENVQQPAERRENEAVSQRPFKAGDKVRVRSLNMQGVITALSENDVEVQLGALRVRAKLNDLQRPGEVAEPEIAGANKTRRNVRNALSDTNSESTKTPASVLRATPGMELDLRGQRAEDALEMLDRYLENAYLSGMPFVRIIHGKGTGKLRQVVREALRDSQHVERFETGHDGEGGDGVTVAHIVND